jgi:hypothetical protein
MNTYPIINRKRFVGSFIEFDYDTPKKNGVHRSGQLLRMYRAKKKDKPLMYVINDQAAGGKPRQFHYNSMRNIKVKTNIN